MTHNSGAEQRPKVQDPQDYAKIMANKETAGYFNPEQQGDKGDIDSKEYLPDDERLKRIDAIADVVDFEYCLKYHGALLLAEQQIASLQSELERVKGERFTENEIMDAAKAVTGEKKYTAETAFFLHHVLTNLKQ